LDPVTIGSRIANSRELSRTLKLYIFDIQLHQASDQQLPGGLLFLLCFSFTQSTHRLLRW
jgi:hypothetical protein